MKEEFKWRKHVCKRNVKGNPKTKHWANDYPEFWPRQEGWKSKQKQCDLKESVTVTPFALQSNCVGDGAIYSRIPNCCERKVGGWQSRYRSRWSDCQADSRYSKAADESCAYQKGILVQKKSSVIGGRRIFLTKMYTTDGKGICRSSWRKWMRCPRRLRVPSLNKIAQTAVRPSPLWEFRAANCFRDLIATLQNENPRRTAVV